MRQIILLLTLLLFSSTTSSNAIAADIQWAQKDTLITHTDEVFTTTLRVWLKNVSNTEKMAFVRMEGDVSAFTMIGNQHSLPLNTLFPLPANDSIWFDINYEADPGRTSFLATLIATTPKDTAELVLAALFTPAPKAAWEIPAITFISPNCQTPARDQAFLINSGQVDVQVDSVKIVDDPTNSFFIESTSPANRMRDFLIGPGGGSVTYNVMFSPVSGSKELKQAKLIAYLSTGAAVTLNMSGVVSVAEASFHEPIISLGLQPLFTDIPYYTAIDNPGTGNFVISAVEILGDIGVTLEGLDIDTVIEPQSSHSFKMIFHNTKGGEKQAQILIFGSPCDNDLVLTVGAEFQIMNVDVDPRQKVRITYAENYVKFEHEAVAPLPYRILDITGRTVLDGSAENNAQVGVSSLINGTYFAIMETSRGPVSKKFIK